MKKVKTTLLLYVLAAVIVALFLPFNAGAYSGPFGGVERETPFTAEGDTNVPAADIGSTFKEWLQGATDGTNFTFVGYGSYAPDIVADQKAGGGALLIYDLLGQNVGAGIGFDWMGRFELISANIELKLPIHVAGLTLTPFGVAGVGIGFDTSETIGDSDSIIAGGGFAANIYNWENGSLNVGYAAVNWFDAGDYTGLRHQAFIAAKLRF